MTKQETAKLIMIIKATYPTAYRDVDPEAMVSAWTMLLAEYPYPVVEAAFLAYSKTDTKGYPPVPGQLIEQMHHDPEQSDEEVWSMVLKAIRNGSYHAQEEFAKLPELIQKAVGGHENIEAWATMPSEEVHTVIHSQVLRSYRTEKDRDRHDTKLPGNIRAILQQTLNALEEKDA